MSHNHLRSTRTTVTTLSRQNSIFETDNQRRHRETTVIPFLNMWFRYALSLGLIICTLAGSSSRHESMIISQHPGISLATVEKQTMVRENRLLYATTTLRCQLHRIPSEPTKGLRGSSARKAPRAVASPQKRRLDEGDADDSVTDDATVTRGPKTVFGVGIGVFLIFLFFFVCWSICLVSRTGRNVFLLLSNRSQIASVNPNNQQQCLRIVTMAASYFVSTSSCHVAITNHLVQSSAAFSGTGL